MDSKETARQRIISWIEDVYDSYKEFEEEMDLKPTTVTEWKRGRSNTFMNFLPEIADALGTTTDFLLGHEHNAYEIKSIPITGRIKAGYPIESFEGNFGSVRVPSAEFSSTSVYFALRVDGDSMMPLVMDKDVIILEKVYSRPVNGKICAVTIDNESTLKRIKIDSTGVTLIPTNPMYQEIHYSKEEAEEKGFRVDGVLIQMIRNFTAI